ncbi:ribose-phosphate diphosphokinase [Bradyrhizobium barranii subsp. barranii]|uniref:Ribose-phosphate diphosphokinase n=1 Tax=Bradyrhizobium barranii subsp. barranii TaxID=2823807 RepID=A0A7Z0QIH4_9BRAD|nr:ribose-phosphate diphosphokinase [Bradyrhizobium barranii]UGX98073.1 ribose-phosphate diphosphokinase [Bradyrhizobium barranii subsp. barranii]
MIRSAVQWLPTSTHFGPRLAEILDVVGHEIILHRFPDGELRATVGPAATTTIVCCSLNQPNEKLIALLFAAEALRRNGAERLVLVSPYLGYMRQDTAFHPGEAISQRAIGTFLSNTFDCVITFDAHLHRTPNLAEVFPGVEAHNLSAAPAIEAHLRAETVAPTTVVVGPDEESRSWVADIAGRLGLAYSVARKVRRSDQSVQIAFTDASLFAGRPVLFIDDIVSSGGTLTACAEVLAASGASSIEGIIVHALFPRELMTAFGRAGIRSVRSTNSVPHPTNAIRLDDLLARALRREFVGMPETGSPP